jgi:parallel beta-helix repeat protein
MRKKLIGIFFCMLMIVSTIIPVSGTTVSEKTSHPLTTGNILYVGGLGPNNYTKIQDAIDNATDSDTVFVFDDLSPYIENIIVHKSIVLTGENKNTTIIDGNKSGDVLFVTADGVFISGFTIMNGKHTKYDNHAGVSICSNYTTISNNIIKNNNFGISIGGTNYKYSIFGNKISDNIISSNTDPGIWLCDCSNNTITNNIVINGGFSGIHANGANNNLISGNELSNNTYGITLYEFTLDQGSNNNKIFGNNLTNNKWRGIRLVNSYNNNISQNNFIENKIGDVKFEYYIKTFRLGNKWNGNYWGHPSKFPSIIFGKISIFYEIVGIGIIPYIQFDSHPAQKPYDIPGMR